MKQNPLHNFAQGFKEALEDITALEVNTMIVSDINGQKFQPLDAYCSIYIIYKTYKMSKICQEIGKLLKKSTPKNQRKIPGEFGEFKEELIAWNYINPQDEIDEGVFANFNEELKVLTRELKFDLLGKIETRPESNLEHNFQGRLDDLQSSLREELDFDGLYHRYLKLGEKFAHIFPFEVRMDNQKMKKIPRPPIPRSIKEKEENGMGDLFNSSRFLRQLRKLVELRSLLENPEAGTTSINDIIYAQTIVQIDGDVINRFHKNIFQESNDKINRESLLKIHHNAVESGEENWRNFLSHIGELIKNILN